MAGESGPLVDGVRLVLTRARRRAGAARRRGDRPAGPPVRPARSTRRCLPRRATRTRPATWRRSFRPATARASGCCAPRASSSPTGPRLPRPVPRRARSPVRERTPRLLHGAGDRARGDGRRHQARLPQAGHGIPSRPQPRRRLGRGEVQGGDRGLRGPEGPRAPRALRPLRPRGGAAGRGARRRRRVRGLRPRGRAARIHARLRRRRRRGGVRGPLRRRGRARVRGAGRTCACASSCRSRRSRPACKKKIQVQAPGALRDLPGHGRAEGRQEDVRPLRRSRPGAPGAVVVLRPVREHRGLPALPRHRGDHREPVPQVPRRGAHRRFDDRRRRRARRRGAGQLHSAARPRRRRAERRARPATCRC